MASRADLTADQPQRLKILFTEGSSLSARQTLYALAGRHTIDIIDPARLCLCRFSRYVRRWYRCPSFSKQPVEYLNFLIQRLKDGDYDVLLATHEQAYLISRFRECLSSYVHVAVPEFEAIERTQSKTGFTRVLEELDLPHPATMILQNRSQLDRQWDYPLYLKLSHGTAGNTVRRVHNETELRKAATDFGLAVSGGPGEFIVQQPAVGSQHTANAVFDRGRLVAAHCSQTTYVGTGGSNLARESVSHPHVVEQVAKIGAHLNWHGALFIEYFYDSHTGRSQFYECNPRVGETFNAYLSGVDLAGALVQVSVGESIERLPDSRPGIRSHSGFMMLMDKALQGGSRRELLSTLRAIRTREGIFSDSQGELTRPREDRLSIIPATWITAQLLARPAIAKKIVRTTVENYSLPEAAADRIRDLPQEIVSEPASAEWKCAEEHPAAHI